MPRTESSIAGMARDLAMLVWSVGSRGLCQPRTEADGEACHGEQPESSHPRKEPPFGADCWAWRHRPLWSHIEIICARRQTLGAFVQIRSPGRTWSALCRPSE